MEKWNYRKKRSENDMIYRKTSGKTIFAVFLPSFVTTLMPSSDVARESATYNCPWLKTSSGRYTPTDLSD